MQGRNRLKLVLVFIFHGVLPLQDDDDIQKAQGQAPGTRHTANVPARYLYRSALARSITLQPLMNDQDSPKS